MDGDRSEGNDRLTIAEVTAAACQSLKACRRCILRVQGVRDAADPSRGADVAGDILRAGGDQTATASGGDDSVAGACGLCLGLLERTADLRKDFRAKLNASGFANEAHRLSVTVPVLCNLRHFVFLHYLRTSLREAGHPEDAASACVHVKEALRCDLIDELAVDMEQCDSSDLADVTVVSTSSYSGPEQSVLECLRRDGGARKKQRRCRGDGAKLEDGGPPVSAATVQDALDGESEETCLSLLDATASVELLQRVASHAVTAFEFGREGIHFRGRYLKMSRRVPQSAWFIDGERKGEASVEEHIIGALARCCGVSACDCHFHAEGREDIDVRMLGLGRPFVVELKNVPRRKLDTTELEAAVNGASDGVVSVKQLVRCSASDMEALQRDAENHRKTYSCVCWSSRRLSESDLSSLMELKDVEILQKSPVRVAHRRGQTVRPRTLHWLQAELINDHYFRLRLSTQAGMYVKEFVHGDLGRTTPSIRSLLKTHAEILQLDVEGMEDS
eukprot:TRINITY_DN1374_c5_g1_i1.p1 TRINITY_DN1374_c5_g1~~TRINITY_DN1374_c5_g1_i1.p1  ORF type:complete len:504 (+),score=84.15 TRINITY_DN1374_c5_g1_i1:128-1639(+)